MSKKEPEVLTIGFSLASLFDLEAMDKIYKEEGLRAYINKLKDMDKNNEYFNPGPALGLYLAFKNLKTQVPKEIIDIRFGISSRNSPNSETDAIFRSMRKWISDYSSADEAKEWDYSHLLDGGDPLPFHKAQGADLVFSTSDESAKKYHENGIASIYIPNMGSAKNLELYNKKDNKIVLVSDFDGVIGDVLSEMNYQNAKLMQGVDPIEFFRKSEMLNRETPMTLGPLGNVVKKLGAIVDYFSELRIDGKIKAEDVPYKTIVVTARGGSAFERFNITHRKYGINVTQAHLMDGRNKNLVLDIIATENKNANILFVDDGHVHFNRALDLKDVLAGFVHNDFTTGKLKATGEVKPVVTPKTDLTLKDIVSEIDKRDSKSTEIQPIESAAEISSLKTKQNVSPKAKNN